MAQSTLSTDTFKYPVTLKQFLNRIFTSVNSMYTELFGDKTVEYLIPLHASKTIYNVFTARRGYRVTSIDYVVDTAQGGALTACVVKATGTATPSTGTTPMQSSTTGINLNGTAHTVQSIALSATAGNLGIVAGQRIALVLSGAMTTGSGNLTIRMTRV
jgi:hypothetical protein